MKYTIKFEFELTQDQVNFLKQLKKAKVAEYRDPEYSTLQEFQQSDNRPTWISDDWFLKRNFNGTYYLVEELYNMKLVKLVEDAWHESYELTDIANKLFEQNEI